MALTRFIIFDDTGGGTGPIVQAFFGDDGSPPAPPVPPLMLLDAGFGELPGFTEGVDGPAVATHEVIVNVLTAKGAPQITAEEQAQRKKDLEERIGLADAVSEKMGLRIYDTTDVDARIVDMVAERDALP